MASKSIFAFVIVLVMLCLFLMRGPSDCITAYGCLGANVAGNTTKEILNRKMFYLLKNKRKASKGRVEAGSFKNGVSWELRKVPSGPDPLHHNGGSPKPKTP